MLGVAVVAGFAALVVSASRPGDAAYPGANGHIAYSYGEGYAYGGGSIWSANADGSSPTMLTNGSNDNFPSYSPSGDRIAFGRENGIAAMNSDGSGLTQLLAGSNSTSSSTKWQKNYKTPEKPPRIVPVVRIHTVSGNWHYFGSPSFSPDGSQIAASEGIEETKFTSICAVEAEKEEKCLEYGDPDAYVDYEFECITCTSRIITVNSMTGARTGTATFPPSKTYDSQPAYSKDGKIAFRRHGPSGTGIYIVSSPGAAPSQLTFNYNDAAPDFSPDGSKIVFSREGEIGLVGTGGGPLTILQTPKPSEALGDYAGAPVFSPDGTKISFERTIFFKGKWDYGISAMRTDGSELTKIVDRGSEPTWQPLALPKPPAIPPKANTKKGRAKLDKKSRATVGAIVCGSSPCELKVLSAKLKAGKKACSVKAKLVKALDPGKTAKVGVKIAGKCLGALKEAGKGSLTIKVRVTDALGAKVLTLKSTVVPGKGKK